MLPQPHASGSPTGRSTLEFMLASGSFSAPHSKHCQADHAPKRKVSEAPGGNNP